MKRSQFYEEAKRLYCNEGFSLDTIVKLLKNNVSRKTLFNWKTEFKWDEQRSEIMKASDDIQSDLVDLAKTAIKNAKADPTSYNIFAVVKAVSALKIVKAIKIDEPAEKVEEDSGDKKIAEESIKQMRKMLGLE